jgi:hypothetical protein
MAMMRAQVSSVGIVKNIAGLCPLHAERARRASALLRQCSAR